MISQIEIESFAQEFGVSFEHVYKDYAISHILLALGKIVDENKLNDIMFFGGTALNRTILKDFRLSEDVDLTSPNYTSDVDLIKEQLPNFLVNGFPDAFWSYEVKKDEKWTGLLNVKDGIVIQIEVVKPRAKWDLYLDAKMSHNVELRYSDLTSQLVLSVPSKNSFVAMKLNAWFDRQAPRDLADLYMLSTSGFFSHDAIEMAGKVSGTKVKPDTYARELPRDVLESWESELIHQGGPVPSAQECFDEFRRALTALTTSPPSPK